MRRMTVGLLVACLVVGGAMPAAGAGFLENRLGIGAWVGYGATSGDSDRNVAFDFDAEPAYGGSLTWYAYRFLSFELSAGYTRFDLSRATAAVPAFDLGETEQVATLFTIRLHPRLEGMFVPYLGLGIGHYRHDLDTSGRARQVLGAGTNATLDNSYGIHGSVGAEYFLGRNIALHLDLTYVWHQADLEIAAGGGAPTVYELDLSGARGLAGVKYYF